MASIHVIQGRASGACQEYARRDANAHYVGTGPPSQNACRGNQNLSWICMERTKGGEGRPLSCGVGKGVYAEEDRWLGTTESMIVELGIKSLMVVAEVVGA